MKSCLIFFFCLLALNSCNFEQIPEKCPTTYVAVTPNGWSEDVTYICGEIRYLPNGRVRGLIKYLNGEHSQDSVDFGSTTNIVAAEDWYVK